MRRVAVATAALAFMMVSIGTSASEEAEVRAALLHFIEVFEQGDVEAMRDAFADDAVTFPRAIMGGDTLDGIDPADYARVTGIDPNMIRIIDRLKASGESAPYLDIQPEDLEIRVDGNMALATFHLVGESSLGRRSFVLQRRDGEWKILHLHASTVLAVERSP